MYIYAYYPLQRNAFRLHSDIETITIVTRGTLAV